MFKQLKGLQHHRTAGARGTPGLIQLPCSEQSLQQQVAQGCPVGFCYLQGWKCHSLSEQPVPVFDHIYSRKAYCFLHWNRISCIPVCAHCLLSCHQASTRKAWLPRFYSPTRYLYTMTRLLWPLFSRLSSHGSQNLRLYEGCPVP